MNLKSGQVELWDSLNPSNLHNQIVFSRLQEFISAFSPSTPSLKKVDILLVPKQNYSNCGVFMLSFMEKILEGKTLENIGVSELIMVDQRKRYFSIVRQNIEMGESNKRNKK